MKISTTPAAIMFKAIMPFGVRRAQRRNLRYGRPRRRPRRLLTGALCHGRGPARPGGRFLPHPIDEAQGGRPRASRHSSTASAI